MMDFQIIKICLIELLFHWNINLGINILLWKHAY